MQAARLRDEQPGRLQKTDIVLVACGGCHSFVNQARNVAGDFSELVREIDYDR